MHRGPANLGACVWLHLASAAVTSPECVTMGPGQPYEKGSMVRRLGVNPALVCVAAVNTAMEKHGHRRETRSLRQGMCAANTNPCVSKYQ